MDSLDQLENRSIYLLREAYGQIKNLCMSPVLNLPKQIKPCINKAEILAFSLFSHF